MEQEEMMREAAVRAQAARHESDGDVRLCEACGGKMEVIDSRVKLDRSIRRRRKCSGCGHRITTYETEAGEGPMGEIHRFRNRLVRVREHVNALIEQIETTLAGADDDTSF